MRIPHPVLLAVVAVAAFVTVDALAGDAVAGELTGEQIANAGNGAGAPPCMSCHGPDGAGNGVAGFPRVAGQDAGYVARQLTLMRDGGRPAPVMAPVVRSLSDAQIDAVADYYARLPIPDIAAPAPDTADATLAERLARFGDWSGRDLPACNACHGPGARGADATFPGLAGQHAGYLKAQLQAFRTGERKTDPGDLMGTVARKLTDEEIDAVSAWLAAQPATAPGVN